MKRFVIMSPAMALAVVLVVLFAFGEIVPARDPRPEETLAASEILRKNIDAGGGPALEKLSSLSFSVGAMAYTVSADGRMKVRSAFDPRAVYEALLVEPSGVRRNRMGRTGEVQGPEAGLWRTLARLAGGGFTLRSFAGPWSSAGPKSYGLRRYHVLECKDGGLDLTANIDAGDLLLKRLVLRGPSDQGTDVEQSIELADFRSEQGLTLPSILFISQPGISQTYSPGPRPLTALKVNEPLPEGFFASLEVNVGTVEAGPGRLKGMVLGALFDPEELFVWIVTNWTEEEVRAAGLQNGDLLIVSSGGAEFATRFFYSEDKVEPQFRVYEPGNSLFTQLPSRFPVFFAQFNKLEPRERFEELRTKVKALAPIEARRRDETPGGPGMGGNNEKPRRTA